jgi:hypothetical protein
MLSGLEARPDPMIKALLFERDGSLWMCVWGDKHKVLVPLWGLSTVIPEPDPEEDA